MEITGLLSKIEHFQVVNTIEKTIKENEPTITINERVNLLKLNIYYLNEIHLLAGKITDLLILNQKSLNPIKDEKIINCINTRFENIPERKFNTLNEDLNYLTNFRIGYIDGLIDGIKKHKKEVFNIMIDEVYKSEFENVHSINQLKTNLKRKIIEDLYPLESDPLKLQEHLQNKLEELKTSYLFKDFKPIQLTGFTCNLHPDTVKEIFNLMIHRGQLSGKLTDFQAIFSKTQTQVTTPVKWLISHNRKPNKTALFTFIKMMLELDEMPIEIIEKSNKLFKYGKGNIFPEKYYPSIEEQRSNYKTHFKQIKQNYFPTFLND